MRMMRLIVIKRNLRVAIHKGGSRRITWLIHMRHVNVWLAIAGPRQALATYEWGRLSTRC